MREPFSRELLVDIHIRLDRQGLQGVTEKELSVLLSETILNSSTFVVEQIVEQIADRLEAQTEQLMAHAEKQTDRIVQHIDAQTEQLMVHDEIQTRLIIDEIHKQTEQLMKHNEIQTDRILHELQPIRTDLAYFRFWTKIIAGGIWAVVASIIANILFQLFLK